MFSNTYEQTYQGYPPQYSAVMDISAHNATGNEGNEAMPCANKD